jgi:hypothetical protein
MGKRPFCTGGHTWEAKGDKFGCINCSAQFPCKAECFHVDCEELKGAPNCEKCKKPIDSDARFYKINSIYHEECIK